MLKKTLAAMLMSAVAAGSVLFIAGCSEEIVGNEKTHPTYIKAKADRDAAKYKDAEDGLLDLLAKAPNSPFLHHELATLYGDCITNDYRAIYHYNRYLELAKALSPDDRKTIHSYIAVCKERAAKKLLADNPSIAPAAATVPAEVSSQIQALQDQIDAYKTQLNTVSGKYLELLKKYKDLAAAKTTATAPVRTAAAPTADATARQAPQPFTGEYSEYEVVPGDNLYKIAKKTGASFSSLLNANGLTKETAGKLKVGQMIKIPKK